jgi:hypothetical protein
MNLFFQQKIKIINLKIKIILLQKIQEVQDYIIIRIISQHTEE